jgi:hypothetical protein
LTRESTLAIIEIAAALLPPHLAEALRNCAIQDDGFVGFDIMTPDGMSEDDQERMADALEEASSRPQWWMN